MKQTLQITLLSLTLALFSFSANAQQLCWEADFDGGLDNSKWVPSSSGSMSAMGTVTSSDCGPSLSGTNYWRFNGPASTALTKRTALTDSIDARYGGYIEFDLVMGMGLANCEKPDAAGPNAPDDVYFECSQNGLFWTGIDTFKAGDVTLETWARYSYNLPQICWSNRMQYRWKQIGHEFNADHWAFDDLKAYCVNLNSPPTVFWDPVDTFSCYDLVEFINTSVGRVDTFTWDWGDGNVDVIATNDTDGHSTTLYSHIYATGTYTVSCIAWNPYGADTLVRANIVVVDLTAAPAQPACTPATDTVTPSCCGNGIVRFQIATLDNTSLDALASGYEDFGCDVTTSAIAGKKYTMTVTTGGFQGQIVKAWLDKNNDAVIDTSERIFFSSGGSGAHTWDVLLPHQGVIYNQLLRLRVASIRASGNTDIPTCATITHGQYEDYTITLLPNTDPPTCSFVVSDTTVCIGDLIWFADSSVDAPTSRLWDFGDASTSLLKNPNHTYTTAGTYDISLTVTNAFGSDQLIKVGHIVVLDAPGLTICTPVVGASGFGYGVLNVEYGTINNASLDANAGGYENFACEIFTELMAGTRPILKITTGNQLNQVNAWIDYNNDRIFTSDEMIVDMQAIQYQNSAPLIRSYGIYDTLIRLRIANERWSVGVNTILPCDTLTNGQYEDYSVKIINNPFPPDPEFVTSTRTGCAGDTIFFTDSTLNSATSWLWDFGDGNTSTLQDPWHIYSFDSLFTITLTATNPNGSSQIVKTNYIAIIFPPGPASCIPYHGTTCCGSGILRVLFNHIDNRSGDASNGYESFDCSATILTAGGTQPMLVVTDSIALNIVKMWIDYNNDSIFDDATELAFESIGVKENHIQVVNVDPFPVIGVPLRMRVANSPWPFVLDIDPCDSIFYGQYEDYQVIIEPNPNAPVADFEVVGYPITCDGKVEFIDLSSNAPTDWLWDFGDGVTSIDQNPSHTYLLNGFYDVSLIATSSLGADTEIKTTYIQVAIGETPKKPNCKPQTLFVNCLQFGIYNVTYGDIDLDSDCGEEGYKDFSCEGRTEIVEAKPYTFSIESSPDNPQDMVVWIDRNEDGNFFESEKVLEVYNSLSPSGTIYLEGRRYEYGKPLRLRVFSDYAGSIIGSCLNPARGQIEDYTVIVTENPDPPIAKFSADPLTNCLQKGIQFTDESENVVYFWDWDFGDGNTSTLPDPLHYYAATGTYTIKMVVCGLYGCDSLTKTSYINIDEPVCSYALGQAPNKVDACEGILFDDGGFVYPDSPYNHNTVATFTIVPAGAEKVTLTFAAFEYALGDTLFIFDGDKFASPLLGAFTGVAIPGPLTANSGAIFIMEQTNSVTALKGFEASWVCNDPGVYAGFRLNPSASDSCGSKLGFLNLSRNANQYVWDFGDGDTSTLEHPVKFYNPSYSGTTYDVTLSASNGTESDDITKTFTNYTLDPGWFSVPHHDSIFLSEGGNIQFFDTSKFLVNAWHWDFGDGTSVEGDIAPSHVYDSIGTYTIVLTVWNSNCEVTYTKDVIVKLDIGINETSPGNYFSIYPNPSMGEFTIALNSRNKEPMKLQVFNLLGEEVHGESLSPAYHLRQNLNLQHLQKGIYFVKVRGRNEEMVKKIVIQ